MVSTIQQQQQQQQSQQQVFDHNMISMMIDQQMALQQQHHQQSSQQDPFSATSTEMWTADMNVDETSAMLTNGPPAIVTGTVTTTTKGVVRRRRSKAQKNNKDMTTLPPQGLTVSSLTFGLGPRTPSMPTPLTPLQLPDYRFQQQLQQPGHPLQPPPPLYQHALATPTSAGPYSPFFFGSRGSQDRTFPCSSGPQDSKGANASAAPHLRSVSNNSGSMVHDHSPLAFQAEVPGSYFRLESSTIKGGKVMNQQHHHHLVSRRVSREDVTMEEHQPDESHLGSVPSSYSPTFAVDDRDDLKVVKSRRRKSHDSVDHDNEHDYTNNGSSNDEEEDDDDDDDDDSSPGRCPECGKDFNSRGLLRSHIVSHSEDRPFTCTECNGTKSYKRNHDLLRHKREKHNLDGQAPASRGSG
ncbi:hypothetical protein BGZ83_009300, partial [Gryganskiella cystojenkinii]